MESNCVSEGYNNSNVSSSYSILNGSNGVLYYSIKNDCEYHESAKRIVHKFIQNNTKVSWNQFELMSDKIDDSDEIYKVSKSVLNKNVDFDTVIFGCNPDKWFNHIDKFKIKFINKKLIGYPSLATNKVSELWVKYMNLMDEIWVPCNKNKEVFERCGVDIPIKVIPYPERKESLPEINSNSLNDLLKKSKLYGNSKKTFQYGCEWNVFYTIGEWTDKNNIEDVVVSYCKSFSETDNVKLIIKTFYSDYTKKNILYCINKLEDVLKQFPSPPEILLITSNLNYKDTLFLHSVGDCYVTMTRGEGFCINAFDAINYGNEVIIPNFGGYIDYLGKNYKGLVNCDLVSVDYKDKSNIYSDDQQWYKPIIEDVVKKLQSYKKPLVENNKLNFSFSFLSDDEKIIESIKQEDKLVDNINLVKVSIKENLEFSGITYIGQIGTSGYATATKGNLCHFFMKGIPVTWIPLYFDNSQLSDECFYNAMSKSLIKKQIDKYDTVIIHATPDIWPELKRQYSDVIKDKKVIGYTVWETSKLPDDWVININNCVDEVWCPSKYNQDVFKNSGVNIPIKVFPHVFLKKELPSKECVNFEFYNKTNSIDYNDCYTFYNISELNSRKGVEDLVDSFCESFTKDDNVRLILKVHYKNYDESNKKYCINMLNNIILKYKNPPKIFYILNNLSEKELLGLHSIGDCYVSLCKSEGFGLTIFEAHKYGKDVITTGYGGQLDFLGEDYKGLVDFKLGKVTNMEGFSKFYSHDHEWAYPVLEHAKLLMKSKVK